MRKYRITRMKFFIVALAAAIVIFGAEDTLFANDEIVAIVNGSAIIEKDLDRQVDILLGQIMDKDEEEPDPERVAQLRRKVLEDLIGRELLYQESRKSGLIVSPEEVDAELRMIKSQFGDAAGYKKALRRMHLSEDEMKLKIRQGKTVKRFIDQEIVDKVNVSDNEVLNYYKKNRDSFKQPEMVRASHILIRVEKNADKITREKAREEILRIRKRIVAGEDFATLAKKFSQGPSRENGGELGYLPRGKLVKPFEDAVFSMKSGQLSDVVETDFGYHLILLHDIKPPSVESFQAAKYKIERFLKQGKVRKGIDREIEKLKKTAQIKRMLPEVAPPDE